MFKAVDTNVTARNSYALALKRWREEKIYEKSIRGFCPHLWCGTRASLAKNDPKEVVEITPAAVAVFEVITSQSLLKNEPIIGESVMENDRPVVNHLGLSAQLYAPKNVRVFRKTNEVFSRKFSNVLQKNQSQQGFNNG
ncbi:hypothetical protein ACEQPO_31360 [Bacillus sp. SL00103]